MTMEFSELQDGLGPIKQRYVETSPCPAGQSGMDLQAAGHVEFEMSGGRFQNSTIMLEPD